MGSSCRQNGYLEIMPGSMTIWQPVFRRHELITGLDTERGNLIWDANGMDQVVITIRLNANDQVRVAAVRSSDEEVVMALERRNCVIQSDKSDQS
jgi:hypothetical protein